ncbi:E3 ubiquitin- ligase TRIM39-like protein [Labeo rohita]|uniref:E3 ubiquitin-ligase TRIM39-like protein n=1 Tax=Labeo rohita TaxID=84645 RepID=A0A498P393_LABRO|nr:E3 ubiquitin- ligase TRIM39-like protein [Labeo rohita]
MGPDDGYWTVILRNENQYKACESPSVSLSLKVKPEIVGVFVDYEEGLVSFHDVGSRSRIYSFTGQTFTDKLYPYFSPGLNDKEEESRQKKNQLVQTQTDVQQMIQNRMKKIQEIQHSVEMRKMYSSLYSRPHAKNWTEISIDSDVNVLPMNRALLQFKKTLHETLDEKLIQFGSTSSLDSRSLMLLSASIQNTQTLPKPREDNVKQFDISLSQCQNQLVQTQTDVQQMIQNRMKMIQEIQHSVVIRKMFSSLCSRPHTKNWTEISIDSDVDVIPMSRALIQFKKTLDETLDGKLIPSGT